MRNEPGTNECHLNIAPILAKIRRLQDDRRYRDRYGLFFVEGVRNFVQAIDHRFPVETLVYSERLLTKPLARKLVRRLKREGVPYAPVSPEQFRSISRTERASGVAAIVRQRVRRLENLAPRNSEFWTALGHVRSPGNLGTLIRTSAATGGAGFILVGDNIDLFDPVVVRATMGALFRQTFVRTSADRLSRWVRLHKLHVIGASPDGAVEYDRLHYSRPAVLMLGDERAGLSEDQRALCHQIVRIPMADGIDSLNLSVAGSLLMYQVYRSPT